MRAIVDQVLATIKQAGYRPTDLARNRKVPFALSEELGVRLGLLMLAAKPLRKTSRMAGLAAAAPRPPQRGRSATPLPAAATAARAPGRDAGWLWFS